MGGQWPRLKSLAGNCVPGIPGGAKGRLEVARDLLQVGMSRKEVGRFAGVALEGPVGSEIQKEWQCDSKAEIANVKT